MKKQSNFFVGLAIGYVTIHVLRYVCTSYLWILFYRGQ